MACSCIPPWVAVFFGVVAAVYSLCTGIVGLASGCQFGALPLVFSAAILLFQCGVCVYRKAGDKEGELGNAWMIAVVSVAGSFSSLGMLNCNGKLRPTREPGWYKIDAALMLLCSDSDITVMAIPIPAIVFVGVSIIWSIISLFSPTREYANHMIETRQPYQARA